MHCYVDDKEQHPIEGGAGGDWCSVRTSFFPLVPRCASLFSFKGATRRCCSVAEAEVAGTVLKMPVSGNKGTWSWFQPYATSDPTQLDPQYANIEVQEDLVGVKWAKGPYTFLEGYLQLMGNLQGKSS